MSRYIDADAYRKDLIELGFLPALVVRALDKQPTADVVDIKVVSEIFEELERLTKNHGITYTQKVISELKKKYTEGKSDGN